MLSLIRQGDLLFIPQADPIPQYVIENKKSRVTDGILAKGEATGHHHRLAEVEAAEVFKVADQTTGGQERPAFVRVGERGVSIVHEEHGPVTLAPNTTYKIHQAREYDYLAEGARFQAD